MSAQTDIGSAISQFAPQRKISCRPCRTRTNAGGHSC